MDWVILVVVLIGTAAALYTAWNSYTSQHNAATSARIARHAAKEAGQERKVASKAARLAVAASGTADPGTAVAQERVSGVPEEFTTPSGVRAHNDPSPGPRVVYGSAARSALAGDVPPDGRAHDPLGWPVPREVADAGYEPPLLLPGQGLVEWANTDPEGWRDAMYDAADPYQGWTEEQRRQLRESLPAAPEWPDPTPSGAQSWPTGSAPEDPSPNGGENSPTEPMLSPGTGGGGTSQGSGSGEKTGEFSRISLRRPTGPTSSSSPTQDGSDHDDE